MSERTVLAQGAVTRVEICPCGACYLTIGPITMCLQSGVLGELGDSIVRALRSLRANPALAEASARPSPCEGERPGEDADQDQAGARHLAHLCSSSKN